MGKYVALLNVPPLLASDFSVRSLGRSILFFGDPGTVFGK
jgi:hypothetical protein